jgi:hypothetical protein
MKSKFDTILDEGQISILSNAKGPVSTKYHREPRNFER